jgi:hypothetical protein
MADLAHQYGADLTLSATGDLALSSGTKEGLERVLRRLLTAPGAYIWHLFYGAGLPRFVGEVANKLRIAAVARSQMYREAAVARTPAPEINVDVQPTGIVSLGIKYSDAATQTTVAANFNLNG